MTGKSPKKYGYAAWLLTKMFDELTGNYFGNAITENQVRPLMSESDRVSDGSISCVEKFDRSNGVGFD